MLLMRLCCHFKNYKNSVSQGTSIYIELKLATVNRKSVLPQIATSQSHRKATESLQLR